ncbi:hypothetical protein [Kordia sp.]
MKTQKKKTFSLNKLQIAKLEQTDFIKGGTIFHGRTDLENGCTNSDS